MKLVARCFLKYFVFVTCSLTNYDGGETASRASCFPKIQHCHTIIMPIFTPRSSPDADGL